MDAVLEFGRATDWASFRAAAAHFAVPAQNLVYADRNGHIGYQAPGQIPIRAAGDGRLPVPGWTGQYEWTGYIPFAQLPSVFDPPSGVIVTANNAVVGSGYPYLLTSDWSDGLRSERITDLLTGADGRSASSRAEGGKLDADAMTRVQMDDRNPFAATLVPYLLAVRPGPVAVAAQNLLRNWDGGQSTDSAAAAYFNAVWRHLLRLTFTDQLSDTAADPDPDGGGRWFEAVGGLLRRPDDVWWSNAKDPRGLRDRDQVLAAALDDAAAELTQKLGSDPGAWRWGDLHTLTLANQTLGVGAPQPIPWLLNRGPYELAGGNDAVDATGWDARDGYAVDWGPSMRMVVDLGDLDHSRWVNQTGASGHAYADSYVDQAPLWATGTMLAWPGSRAAVDAGAKHRLTLVPASGS
jgi:penicillin amidase